MIDARIDIINLKSTDTVKRVYSLLNDEKNKKKK